MSKQYLTSATHSSVHPSPVFALTSTPSHLLSASGSSSLLVHSATSSSFPLLQSIPAAHKLGAHHLTSSADGKRAVSIGFNGQINIWSCSDPSFAPLSSSPSTDPTSTDVNSSPTISEEIWKHEGTLFDGLTNSKTKKLKPGEAWAMALSSDGAYLAGTAIGGCIHVWDLTSADPRSWQLERTYETKGSFGLCIDISPDSSLTASGHQSGSIYVFDNSSGRLKHSLPGLAGKAVRTIKFSPGGTLLAAGGDAKTIGLYDAAHGEQVARLSGHQSWVMSLDWSAGTGEYVVSGDYGGKVRVWRTETRECVSVLQMEEAEGAVWSVCWLKGGGSGTRRQDGFVVGTEGGGLRFLREAAGG